ncbi:hypothetical protein [Marinobacter mangrovi]|uniref:hypothetical protein n=1 Tax=Marinobacter mangrovi TaxID=2803918 RepID=UPI001932074D|nr:hypothetical protein [Marinobacter mangrovi]
MILEKTERYADESLNPECIPPLPDCKKRSRVGDELQPWGDYATVNPYQKIIMDVADVQSVEANGVDFENDEWWGWNHQRLQFINDRTGTQALVVLIPYAWTIFLVGIVPILTGWMTIKIVSAWNFPTLLTTLTTTALLIISLVAGVFLLPTTTNWIMTKGLGVILKPFERSLQKKVDNSLADGMSEFNRVTGQAKFALGKGRHFEAPFIEFDAYVERVVQRGGIFYRLMFVHRYTGKIFNKTWLSGVEASKNEVLALWDMLQRFMDVSQPIPDMPRFEPFRHLDPVTAEHDDKTNRPPRYWRDLDLEAWKANEGAELAKAQAQFPWNQRRCKLTPKLGQVEMEVYRKQRPETAVPI